MANVCQSAITILGPRRHEFAAEFTPILRDLHYFEPDEVGPVNGPGQCLTWHCTTRWAPPVEAIDELAAKYHAVVLLSFYEESPCRGRIAWTPTRHNVPDPKPDPGSNETDAMYGWALELLNSHDVWVAAYLTEDAPPNVVDLPGAKPNPYSKPPYHPNPFQDAPPTESQRGRAAKEERLALRLNNCISNDPCALCGWRTDPSGYDVMLADRPVLVCDGCTRERAPWLLDMRDMWGALVREVTEALEGRSQVIVPQCGPFAVGPFGRRDP